MVKRQSVPTRTVLILIALFSVIILAAAAITLAVGPAAPAQEETPQPQPSEEIPLASEMNGQEEEELWDEPEGEVIDSQPVTYNKPGEMRAVYLVPGKDFLTSTPMAADKVKAEVDKAIADAVSLTMNTVIIDTNATESVIYNNDILPVTSESFDIMGYLVDKARANNLYVYAIYDVLQEFDGAALSQPGAVTGEVLDNSAEALLSLTEYNIDGVLLRSYYNEATPSSYADYLRADGSIGFENYMTQVPDNAVERISKLMRTKARGIQLGVLTDPVWLNASQNEAGSATNAAFTTLGTGNADVKAYVEEGLVDFVAVEAYGSIADGVIPFETVTKWWSNLCLHNGTDLYVVQYSSRMCSNYTGWSSADELAKQVTLLQEQSGYCGSAFNSLSRLMENPGGGTDTLLKVFKEEINPDFLFTELTVSKPELTEFSTEERNVTFAGGSDPTKPVTINGKEIETDETGFFSVTYELAAGENTFTIAHKEKSITYTVTRNITVLKEIGPTGNLTVDGGMEITVWALAYEGSTVTATLNGQTVTLSQSDEEDDETDKESSYVKYVGVLTAPEATSKVQSLGQIVVAANYEGTKMTMNGAHVNVNKLVDISDGEPVVVTAAQAETFPTSRLDDISDPDCYPLAKGVLDYTVGDQIVYKDGGTTYTYYNLASGQRVYANNVGSTSKKASKNVISGLKVDSTSRYTTVTLFSDQPVSYIFKYSSSGIKIEFQNTTSVPDDLTLTKNPLFSSAKWSGSTLTLKLKNGFLGYKAYTEGSQIVFRFNNPPAMNGGGLGGAYIVVDSGHGGSDPGAVSFPGMTEADINYAVSKKLVDELEDMGANVKLIGHDTSRVQGRATTAENYNANLYVAVHCNAAGSSAVGSEAYYFRPWSSKLASGVSGAAAGGLSTTNRGGKYGLYYVTRGSQYPSVLAECGFMTNQSEFKKLCTSSYQSKIAARMAAAIEDYLDAMGGGTVITGVQTVGSTDLADATGVTLDATTLSLEVGQTKTLTATVKPNNADQSITWSTSNAKIAKVDENGLVTAVKAGTATVTATTHNGKTASCEVTVTEPITVTLDQTTLDMVVGDTVTLTATVKQGTKVLTDQKLVWKSSSSKVATVDSSGKVTAVKAGDATVTVALDSNSEKTATCTVKVKDAAVPVTKITLDPATLSLMPEETATIKATVLPENATDPSLKWTSSNTSVAKVSSSGKVTAVAEGKATITAEANDGSGIKATCEVTVAKRVILVTKITVDPGSLSLTVGDTAELTATVAPEDASNPSVKWTSSDTKVVEVSSSGKVTAIGPGTATVTAAAEDGSGISGKCEVTVAEAEQEPIPVEGVEISQESKDCAVGDTFTLTATVAPSDAANTKVTWSSSDEAVVKVDSSGKVTVVGPGTATVTCTTVDGGFTDQCTVTAV